MQGSHRLSQWLLTQGWRNCAAYDLSIDRLNVIARVNCDYNLAVKNFYCIQIRIKRNYGRNN